MIPGRKGRIDHIKMRELLKQGKSQSEIALHFNVSRSAVSQARKTLSQSLTKHVAMESAVKILDVELDGAEQLVRANQIANDLLDDLMEQIKGKKPAEMSKRDLRDLALKTLGEIRRQLDQQAGILEKIANWEAVSSFQQEILQLILNEVRPDERQRIVSKLKERRAIRASLRISPR